MGERVFGLETEYAVSALDGRGSRTNQPALLDALLRQARKRHPHLPDQHGHGIFLQNGARFYVDCGGHPEITTPECSNPWDAVRYVHAGETILLALVDEQAARRGLRPGIYRCNVDYSGTHATWGCHESYMHRVEPDALPADLIPHLVSRVIYGGAGGFSNVSPGIEFTLSPRATHITTDVSIDSTGRRGIYHTKDEALCGHGYHRLHVLYGESLCSDLAAWLKVGATALVVALCDAGLRPGAEVALQAPVTAMRAFAGDPCGDATALTRRGQWKTAIAIQRHYLELAELHAGAHFMPPWAGEVCRRWRAVLDRLSGGWESSATMLDWAMKLALFRKRAARRGLAWEALASWNRIVRLLAAAFAKQPVPIRSSAITAELVLGTRSPVAVEVEHLTPLLDGMGLAWSGLEPFLALRTELFEIDLRFGEVGPAGIFSRLDAAGALAHHVDGVDNVEHAMANPTTVGRAQVRGRLVRELSGTGAGLHCSWQGVWDFERGRHVDLSDPFSTNAEWRPWSTDEPEIPRGFLAGLDERLQGLRRERGRRRARAGTGGGEGGGDGSGTGSGGGQGELPGT